MTRRSSARMHDSAITLAAVAKNKKISATTRLSRALAGSSRKRGGELRFHLLLAFCALTALCAWVEGAHAVPRYRLSYALFRGENGVADQLIPVNQVYLVPGASSENNNAQVPIKRVAVGKKYDRNCFFSPIQCMLSFKEHQLTDDEAYFVGKG